MLEEFKAIHRKVYKEDLPDKEARDSARNLLNFVKLLVDITARDLRRKARFKNEPDGFPVDGQYTCKLCRIPIDETTGWFTWYGPVCLICDRAIKSSAVPIFVLQNRDSYFLISDLKRVFDLHPATARKYLREGKLIAREVLNDNGTVHEQILLKRDNPGLIQRRSPERKSYDRHQRKITKQAMRLERLKRREEFAKMKKRYSSVA